MLKDRFIFCYQFPNFYFYFSYFSRKYRTINTSIRKIYIIAQKKDLEKVTDPSEVNLN